MQTGWKKLRNPDVFETKTKLNITTIDSPLQIALCPTGQFSMESLKTFGYINHEKMLKGILSNPGRLAWGAQKSTTFVNMTNGMIDTEIDVCFDDVDTISRKFHSVLGICWLLKPDVQNNKKMQINVSFKKKKPK